jgi:hypothetical protein
MSRYAELVAKVDVFFERVVSRHGPEMQCGSGCHDCCMVQLSVTQVEADAVRAELVTLSEEARARLRERARAPREDRCVALDDDGRCAFYEARPLVCRSHGAPIRMRDAAHGPRALPVIDACPRNFPSGLAAIEDACVLDQTTLSTLLYAVDLERARAAGLEAGRRVPLVEVVLEATGPARGTCATPGKT